jgi:tetratricopeptide (TPR) repeat protein
MRHCALVLAVVLPAAARADDASSRMAARQAAVQIATDALRSGDPAKLIACGTAYADLHNQDPGDPHDDEILNSAAVCFEKARSIGMALRLYEALIDQHPSSKLAAREELKLAHWYAELAMFDRAAKHFEQYAQRYAGEPEVGDALFEAISYRHALGDTKQEIADAKRFLSTTGVRSRTRVAEVTWAMIDRYETPDERIRALREYIRLYPTESPDRTTIAFALIGDLLWRKSCPVEPVGGLCIARVRDKAMRCANGPVFRAVARVSTTAKEALQAYRTAIHRLESSPPAFSEVFHAVVTARIAAGDNELERMYATPAPADATRAADWLAAQTQIGESARRRYDEVLDRKDPAATIAVRERLGHIADALANQLRGVRVPATALRDPRPFCEPLEQQAGPLAADAARGYHECLNKGAELGIASSWTALCSSEGRALDPGGFPEPDELPPVTFVPAVASDGPAPGPGELHWNAGRRGAAVVAWNAAVAADGRLFAPHVDLAIAGLEMLRASPRHGMRHQLVVDASNHASNALAASAAPQPLPLVVLALLALEDQPAPPLELARMLVDQAISIDPRSAAALAAAGIIAIRRDRWTAALAALEGAASLAPHDDIIQLAAAIAALKVGQPDIADAHLAAVQATSYDVLVARGAAAHALGKPSDARALFEQAIALDPTRPEARHDLAALP